MTANANILPSSRISVQAVLNPVSQTAATVTTGWVNAAAFGYLLALLAVGAMSSSGTLDAKLQQASDSSGTGAKDITGKAITQLTQAGTDSNKQVMINCRPDELDTTNGFTHVRLSVTAATAASLIFAAIFGLDAHYAPASQAATVDEVVS